MAAHRSPGARRARWHRPAPAGAALRTNVLAGAAAVGAVATGTLATLVPTGPAAAGPVETALAASSAPLDTPVVAVAEVGAAFVPVGLAAAGGTDPAAADEHLALLDKATGLAAQLAELHAREAEAARVATLIDQGGLDGWIAEALHILGLPQSLAPGIKKIIIAESGGNPRAVNEWDSNARRGTPSQGLMQTIPSTFRAFVHPDLAERSITDPVANITAGIRYMVATYGIDTLRDGGRRSTSGSYVGY